MDGDGAQDGEVDGEVVFAKYGLLQFWGRRGDVRLGYRPDRICAAILAQNEHLLFTTIQWDLGHANPSLFPSTL